MMRICFKCVGSAHIMTASDTADTDTESVDIVCNVGMLVDMQ